MVDDGAAGRVGDSIMPDQRQRRRFPRPWTVEQSDGAFIVKDANGMRLAFVYYPTNHEGLGTLARDHLSPDEARRIATFFARAPDLIGER